MEWLFYDEYVNGIILSSPETAFKMSLRLKSKRSFYFRPRKLAIGGNIIPYKHRKFVREY